MKTECRYKLRLYVTSTGARSSRAIVNVRRICEENLRGIYDLDIVDIGLHPQLASSEQLVAAPTLVKLLPLPVRRFVGDMSQTARILSGLNLAADPTGAEG
ncbi:MAG TPA: circadian clock KaiB family protein [Planctomycetota bacterium]|nr:circadian clock KaiB family protein [Planctomycetota bacterium]